MKAAQVIPQHYILKGESLDTAGNVMFARRMLATKPGWASTFNP